MGNTLLSISYTLSFIQAYTHSRLGSLANTLTPVLTHTHTHVEIMDEDTLLKKLQEENE